MDDGLASVGEALALADKTEERCWQAELNRIKGELPLAVSSNNHAESESCFSQALDIARNQQAKSWELRRALEELRSRELHPEEERRLVYARAFAAEKTINYELFTKGHLSERAYRDLCHRVGLEAKKQTLREAPRRGGCRSRFVDAGFRCGLCGGYDWRR